MSTSQVQSWLDQEDAHTADVIRRHGVYIQYVGGDPDAHQMPFAYTVGLFGIGHAELAVIGITPHTASALLNEVSARIRAGENLVPGMVLAFDGWAHRVIVEEIPNPGEIAFAANRFYQRPDEYSVPLLQLTYDDLGGRFPTEPGYANEEWMQPRPGSWRA